METRVTTGTLVALACSAVLVYAAPQQTNPSTETISGCVQQGASANAFVLASAPHTTWELLPASRTDLSKMVGKRVEVTGMAVIGPTGTEPSRASGNAGVTRFMVKTIKPTAGSC